MEVRDAPLYRHVCQTGSLGQDGLPRRVGDISGLDAYGVKPADVPGEPTYLNYVRRDDDDDLREALREAIAARRMLLVVGGSAAGKSRSTAEAVRDLLPQHRLIRPRSEMLAAVCDLALAELGPAVVWLDDVQQYAHQALRDTLKRLLQAGLVVIGTIRRAELDLLAPAGDVRNPAGEALTDAKLVRTVNWRLEWTPQERARLAERARYPLLLEAVAKGTSPGAYVVAGPLLVRRLNDAQVDEEHPCNYALVRTVLDWYRTGIAQPIPIDEAVALLRIGAEGDTGTRAGRDRRCAQVGSPCGHRRRPQNPPEPRDPRQDRSARHQRLPDRPRSAPPRKRGSEARLAGGTQCSDERRDDCKVSDSGESAARHTSNDSQRSLSPRCKS